MAGEQFDLVVTNPPFVISPATGERLVYRDSGLPGDRVVEHLVRARARPPASGGCARCWPTGRSGATSPWEERLADWVAGCDAWVVQREVVDLPTYVELWLKDAGLHGRPGLRRATTPGCRGSRSRASRRSGSAGSTCARTDADRRCCEPRSGPTTSSSRSAPRSPAYFARAEALRGLDDDALLARAYDARRDVRQETYGAPGAEDPAEIVLRQQRGLRRARQADTVEAALVGACDGELTVGQILDALAQLLDRAPAEVRSAYLPVVRELVADGFLELP